MQRPFYHPRWLEHRLSAARSRGKVRLLLGARQTGKSRLLQRVAPEGARRVELQDVRVRQAYERSPGRLTAELEASRGRRVPVVLDEIQKVPSLLDEVQYLHDRDPGRFEFYVSGSSARRLRAGSANLLPGRAHLFTLFPVVAAEQGGWGKSAVLPLAGPLGKGPGFPPVPLEDRLVYGSLPGVLAEPAARRAETLQAYAEVYLEEEIRREAVVRDFGAFARFLELAALESGNLVNLTRLSQETGIPIPTVRSHYQVLEDTFVGAWIPPLGNSRKSILATPRFVFFDTGVRNAAARLPFSRELLRTQSGTLFEQFVLTELVHRAGYLGRTVRVHSWRTRYDVEVDAVVRTPKGLLPVEAKWTENPRPADAKHLELFLDAHPRQARRGWLVCRCPHPMRLTDRVEAIPWTML